MLLFEDGEAKAGPVIGQCLEGQEVLIHPLDRKRRRDWTLQWPRCEQADLEAREGGHADVWTFEEEEEEANQELVRPGRLGSSMEVEKRMNLRWAHWLTDSAAADDAAAAGETAAAAVDAAAAGEAAAAAVATAAAVESSCFEFGAMLAQVVMS